MVNQPIKLQDKLYLYSGDVITINGSSPLLVEIVSTDKQTIKLRNIKDNKYLKEKNISLRSKLKFSADFENSLIFTVKKNSESKISLQTDKDKYLKLKDKEFRLSSKERWLDPAKQQNTENIANFEEIIESVEFDRGKEEKNGNKELLIAYRFYNNKNCNPLPINCSFTESKQREQSFTFSADFTLGASVNLKLSCPSISGIDIGGKFETKSGTSNTIKKTDTITIQESINPTCSPWKKNANWIESKKH